MSTHETRLRERKEAAIRSELAQHVAQGITLLSKHDPNWRMKIVMSRLSMMSCADCILGQLFGSYEEGLLILDIGRDDLPNQYGFRAVDPTNYRVLQGIWLERLD